MNRKKTDKKSTAKITDTGRVSIPLLAVGKGWLVVDKPAGMSVHNEPGGDLCSLVSAHILKNAAVREQTAIEPGFGVHPVHRLDRETSGVILLAVSREMFRFFSSQFESHKVAKRYLAILHGILENPPGSDAWQMWRWPLSKNAGGRNNPEGSGDLRESLTRYHVLESGMHYTMVEVEPLSGRTHQIRRHAKLAGHPVVGDARYGSTRAINYLRQNAGFDRLALHSRTLTFQLPGGSGPKTVEAPMPEPMRVLFENDRAVEEDRSIPESS